jgi:hypothetical protein
MEAVMNDTIVTVRFAEVGAARRALRMLELLDSEGQLRVRAATLVERSGDGRSAGPDGGFAPQGGVVGALVDALSGPVGDTFARPTEGFRAHGAPWAHADDRAAALEEISRDLEPAVALVIAEIEDPDPEVLDSALDALGGSASGRPAEAFYVARQAASPR